MFKRIVLLLLPMLLAAACTKSSPSPVPAAPTEPPRPTATPLAPTVTPTELPRPTATPLALTATPVPTVAEAAPMTGKAFEINRLLGQGVNFGNALEAPREGDWGVILQEEYFQMVKDKGFDSVRIPVRWSAHALTEAPYTIDSAFFERIDWAVNQALSRNLAVVLNMHHYEEIFKEPQAHTERYLAIWRQIAEHYQDYPDELLFEPLNEPNTAFTADLWNELVAEVLQVVRASNPERVVVLGPVEWNSVYRFNGLKLPEEDRYIIVTYHYYNPFRFTHQGAEWAQGSANWLGLQWTGSANEKQVVQREFDMVSRWAAENGRPVYMGEFGAYYKADMDSRARWTEYVARQAEERGFSWAYWEFCSGFGIYVPDKMIWMDLILRALIPQ